jgi:hypothetical protein
MPGQWDGLAGWIHEGLGIEEATMDTFWGPVTARIQLGLTGEQLAALRVEASI